MPNAILATASRALAVAVPIVCAAIGSGAEVEIQAARVENGGFDFTPPTIAVRPGDTVLWKTEAGVGEAIRFEECWGEWTSPPLVGAEPTYRRSFPSEGIVIYRKRRFSTDDPPVLLGERLGTITVLPRSQSAPPVMLNYPEEGSVSSALFGTYLQATAEPSLGPVIRMDFYVDGSLLAGTTSPPYRLAAPLGNALRPPTNGLHAVSARAILANGQEVGSDPVRVYVVSSCQNRRAALSRPRMGPHGVFLFDYTTCGMRGAVVGTPDFRERTMIVSDSVLFLFSTGTYVVLNSNSAPAGFFYVNLID